MLGTLVAVLDRSWQLEGTETEVGFYTWSDPADPIGWRAGISVDGRWSWFVAGD